MLLTPEEYLAEYLAYKVTRKAKYIIYTAISKNYDDLFQHTYICKDADYVCYADVPIADAGIWEIRALLTQQLDRVRSAKYYKLFPDHLFPDDQYSLWIDGNIDVVNNRLEQRLNDLVDSAVVISANPHFERDCAYEEASVCLFAKLDDSEVIRREVQHLKQESFPYNFGLFEMNIIFRQHHHVVNISVMGTWWDMILRFSRRDQISFTYALHKNNSACERLFLRNSRLDKDFAFKPHNPQVAFMLYVDIGHGFNASNAVKCECRIHGEHRFEAAFDLQSFGPVEKLCFDPLEKRFCKLLLERIEIDMASPIADQSTMQLVQQRDCAFNGVIAEDGFIEFESLDSFVIFQAKGRIERVVIQGKIMLLDSTAELNKLTQRRDLMLAQSNALKLENEALQSGIAQLQETVETCQMHLTNNHVTIQNLNHYVNEMQASLTWKIGQKVLWLPRLLFKR